jgi:serine/threonine protein kinase
VPLPRHWSPDGFRERIDSGQAEVFPVRRAAADDGLYALKRLKNPARSARFIREIAVMRELHTSGLSVPEIVEDGVLQGRPYFVMPWFEGGSLEERIKEGHFADELTHGLDLLIALAETLSRAHEQGHAHRDVKPRNVLLDDGHPVLTDFGLSLSASEENPDTRLTETHEGVGSRLYIAPENEGGFNESVDQRPADFYAFGKVAWAVLAGRQPPAREDQQLRENHLAVIHRNVDLELLDQLLTDATQLDPRVRLGDWSTVVKTLGDAARSLQGVDPDLDQDDIVKRAVQAARRIRTSEAAVEADRAERHHQSLAQARAGLREALRRGISGRDDELSRISNEASPVLRIQAGDGYKVGSTPQDLRAVGLPSPEGLVVDQLPPSALVEDSPAAIRIYVAAGDPGIDCVQLGLHPIATEGKAWILRAPLAMRSAPHLIVPITSLSARYASWTGPLGLGLGTTAARAEQLAAQTITAGIELFNECAEHLDAGHRLSEAATWGMESWALERRDGSSRPPPLLSFGKARIGRWQSIVVQDDAGNAVQAGTGTGRIIRVPVTNAQGAGEARDVHATLTFGDSDSQFYPPSTQGEWVGESGPELMVNLPGNGGERLIDAVLVLDREYPHAFEWTRHSRAAGLRDSAIMATPFDVRIKVAGSGATPILENVLEIEIRRGHLIRADWKDRGVEDATNLAWWRGSR